MKGRVIPYTTDELRWIETHRETPRRKMHAQFVEKFGRTDVSLTNINSLCKRKGFMTGRHGRYPPGNTPFNKGKKITPHPNSMRTQFKKGDLPKNAKYIGRERLNREGYTEICVAEKNPYTGHSRHYTLKHKYMWEAENGPVPEGHCLKCLDGNKQNTALENWEAIPRAMLPALSGPWGRGFETAAPEIKPVIMAITKLEHKTKEMMRDDPRRDSAKESRQNAAQGSGTARGT